MMTSDIGLCAFHSGIFFWSGRYRWTSGRVKVKLWNWDYILFVFNKHGICLYTAIGLMYLVQINMSIIFNINLTRIHISAVYIYKNKSPKENVYIHETSLGAAWQTYFLVNMKSNLIFRWLSHYMVHGISWYEANRFNPT